MRANPRSRPVRSRAATILAGAILLFVAAGCSGGSSTPTAAAPASAAPSTAASPAAEPSTGGGGDAGGGGTGGGGAACDGVQEAATKVALEMTLLLQADSAAQWKAMTDPNGAVRLDPAATAAALDVLARLPGSGDLVTSYREIVDLEAQAVAGDAWGGGTGPGARANKLIADRYVDLGVGLSTLLGETGC